MAWGNENNHEVKCSEISSPDVYIEIKARQKITYLMDEYTHLEWLAYLVGKESEQGNFFVEDIVVPPHETTSGASAEPEPFTVPENCVGVIHSHHSMGAFHSHTDQTHVDRNHPISVIVAKRNGNLEFNAVSAQRTPCGKMSVVASSVMYVAPPPLFDKDEWLEEAKENIDKGRVSVVKYPTTVYQSALCPAQTGKPMTRKEWKKARKKEAEQAELQPNDVEELMSYYHNYFGQTLTKEEIEEMVNGDLEAYGVGGI